jgi:hypothetical protein
MIESGEKKEEYRDYTNYWHKRLVNKDYTHILFINGYRKDSRRMIKEIDTTDINFGNEAWGAEKDRIYYIFKFKGTI